MKTLLVIISILLFYDIGQCQKTNPVVDSLEKVVSTSADKKAVIYAKAELVKFYFNAGDNEKAMLLYSRTLSEAKSMNYDAGIGALYNSFGCNFYIISQYDSALLYFEKSLEYREKAKDGMGILKTLNNIGSINYSIGNYKKGLQYLEKGLKKESELGLEEGTVISINNFGLIYIGLKLYRKSFYYFKKAEKVNKATNDIQSLVYTYDGMATAYQSLNIIDSALFYSEKSLKCAEKVNDVYSIAYSLNSIGTLYNEKKQYSRAKEYFEKSLLLSKKINDQRLELSIYGNLAITMMGEENEEEAYKYALWVLELGNKFNIKTDQLAISELLSSYFFKKKDYAKAYLYLKNYNRYKDSLYNIGITNQITELQTKYETEKKEKVNQLLYKDALLKKEEIKKQTFLRDAFIIGFILILIIAAVLYNRYKIKKKSNIELSFRNNTIMQQKEEIETQRDEISTLYEITVQSKQEIEDSIHYAKRIQSAILPETDNLKKYVSEYFLLYMPKDVVAGDFYITVVVNDWLIVAVADCTGHGVPGAFMSMLGISFINEIVHKKEVTKASEVLELLRQSVIEALKQKGESGEQKDGMDIGLCAINTTTLELQFAGANNPCWIVASRQEAESSHELTTAAEDCQLFEAVSELVELKPDKQPIGIHANMQPFSNQKYQLQKGEIIYLMSDGFEDQFGGPNRKKFLAKNLKNLLIANCQLPMADQKHILETTITEWIGSSEQIDDITILGIRL